VAGDDTLAQGERLVMKLHPHWKTLLRPFLMVAVVVVAAVALLVLLPPQRYGTVARLAVGALVLAALIIWGAVPLLRWWTTTYELTTRRLRLRDGIMSRTGRDFPLMRISDVSYSHGLLDRMLGCGRLVVESPGENSQLVLTEIPQVKRVQATLFQLVEDEHERLAREER
jgi:uncharacterized membrane protein YdbT with pleckstrin-like domain